MKKILLIIALLISGLGLNAQSVGDQTTIYYEGYSYSLEFTVTSVSQAECEVRCGYKPTTETELTIPSTVTINGKLYSVTSIADSAFLECGKFVGDLVLPNTIKSVGIRAFRDCAGFEGSLTLSENLEIIEDLAFAGGGDVEVNYTGELIIPNKVKHIGQAAFQNCSSLSGNLTIPNSVTSIGESAFWECRGFNGSLVLSENLDTISDYAFGSYDGEMGFKGELLIPENVKYIGRAAFQKCSSLTGNLTIPNSVTSIGDYAFFDCSSLTGNLTIPNSVTSIGEYAFDYCSSLKSVTFEEDSQLSTIGKSAFRNCFSLTGNLTIPNSVTSIGEYAFDYCSSLKSVTFEENSQLSTIGKSAFCNCSSLTGNLTIPNSVTSIGDDAFFNCSSLTGNLTIPNSVTSIGESAFAYCSSLEYVEIPANVTFINSYAFYSCSSLKSIICYAEYVPYTVSNAFSGVPSDMVIYVPANFVNAYKTSNPWRSYTILSIPNVIITVNPENAGTVTGAGTYKKDAIAKIIATPNEGYRFVNWTEGNIILTTEAEYSFTVTSDVELVANFELLTYDVTISANPENAGTVTGAGKYSHGSEVALTATPNEGYRFVNWTKDEEVVSTETEYSFTITNDVELVANFELLTYDVTVSANPENAGTVTGAGTYKKNAIAKIIATPNEGYRFVNWTEGNIILTTEAEYSFTVTSDVELVANFVSTESIDELSSSFNIYPNPVNDKLYIETEIGIEEIAVYDVYGRQLLAVSCQPSAIDVAGLNSGVYFVMIKTNNGTITKRFVKQ